MQFLLNHPRRCLLIQQIISKKIVASILCALGLVFILSVLDNCIALNLRSSQSYNISGNLRISVIPSILNSPSYRGRGILMDKPFGILQAQSYLIRNRTILPSLNKLLVGIYSISPNSAYNTGVIDIKITGFGFKNGANVFLSTLGEENINAQNIIVDSTSTIYCSFNLTGKKDGMWDLNIINPDYTSSTLANAFEIRTIADLGTIVNYPNPFNPLQQSTLLIYKLTQNTDITILIFNITAELIYSQNFLSGTNGAKAGMNTVEWNGINSFGEVCANGVYFVRVVETHTGKILAKGKVAISR